MAEHVKWNLRKDVALCQYLGLGVHVSSENPKGSIFLIRIGGKPQNYVTSEPLWDVSPKISQYDIIPGRLSESTTV